MRTLGPWYGIGDMYSFRVQARPLNLSPAIAPRGHDDAAVIECFRAKNK